jgi:hypothetical protein
MSSKYGLNWSRTVYEYMMQEPRPSLSQSVAFAIAQLKVFGLHLTWIGSLPLQHCTAALARLLSEPLLSDVSLCEGRLLFYGVLVIS